MRMFHRHFLCVRALNICGPRAYSKFFSSMHVSWLMQVSAGHSTIGWSREGDTIWVSNPERLGREHIPKYYDHSSYAAPQPHVLIFSSNPAESIVVALGSGSACCLHSAPIFPLRRYASWTRALHAHSFRKLTPSTWSHPSFHRDRPEAASTIVRKRPPHRGGKPAREEKALLAEPKATRVKRKDKDLKLLDTAIDKAVESLPPLTACAVKEEIEVRTPLRIASPLSVRAMHARVTAFCPP